MESTAEKIDINYLVEKAKEGDSLARASVVNSNLGLVWGVVKRFNNRGHEPEDLFQIGCIGLIKAIDKFDSSFDVKFSTYAVHMIVGEIKKFLRDDGAIKVSRSLKEIGNKARIIKENIIKQTGEEPSIKEVALQLGISVEEAAMAVEASYPIESIYKTVDDNDGNAMLLMDKIIAESVGEGEKEGDIINKIAVRQMLGMLSDRDKQIIILRYFKRYTQTQIAQRLKMSQVQVSRAEAKILKYLRGKV